MDRTTRSRLIAAGTLSAAGLLLLGACGGGGGGNAAAPTSVVDSTAFRTIPVTAPPTTAAPPSSAAASGDAGSAGASGGATQAGGVQGNVYVVVDNDYWYAIGDKLGIKPEVLAAYNDMTIKTPLYAGMQLRIPPASATGGSGSSGSSGSGSNGSGSGSGGSGTTQPQGNYYIAVANDFWPLIAKKLGVSVDALLAANNATMQTPVYVGQKIKIPG